MLHGIMVLDKPVGKTSHDMVSWARRILRQKRIGHTGTLDPMASGVLPLCLGEATKLSEYLTAMRKAYLAEVTLGYSSNTYDAEGVLEESNGSFDFSHNEIEAVLHGFCGNIEQTPPIYSAISVKGKRLYQYARNNEEVVVPKRKVEIETLSLQNEDAQERFSNGSKLLLAVSCSKGTYIRSLAHDIGQALGCGAYLSALRRTASGTISLKEALSIDLIEELVLKGDAPNSLISLDEELFDMAIYEASDTALLHFGHGRFFSSDLVREIVSETSSRGKDQASITSGKTEYVLLAAHGYLRGVALMERDLKRLKPHKVFTHPIKMRNEKVI